MSEEENENKIMDQSPALLKMLLTFYDELVLVEEDCAFLCEAVSCFLERPEGVASHVVNGFARQADGLVFRMDGLKANFREVLGVVRRNGGDG